jgi:ribosome-binding factor A
MDIKHEKIEGTLIRAAAEYFNLESSGASLITVTSARLSPDGKYMTFYVSILPLEKEGAALDFMKRKRSEFRQYVKGHTRIGRLPFFEIAIDKGEKNRQKIDELLLLNPPTNNDSL